MDPTDGQDHYAVLGVAEDATIEEIEQAFAYRLRLSHPDLYPGDARVQRWAARLEAAREVLADPARRARYDRTRAARQPVAAAVPPVPPAEPGRDAGLAEGAVTNPVQTGKVVLTAEQARDGCSVQWVQDAPEGSWVRTLAIPPGTEAGTVLRFPSVDINGATFPALRLGLVIESGAAPPPELSLVDFQETEVRKPRSPVPLRIAAASVLAVAIGLVIVIGVGAVGGEPAEQPLADPAAQEAEAPESQEEPTQRAAPSPAPATADDADDSPEADTVDAGPLLAEEVVASKAAIRAVAPGVWMPQVGSLCAGPQQADLVGPQDRLGYPDGRPEAYSGLTEADILAFHRAVDARFDGAALLVDGTATAVCRTPARWVSLLDAPQPSSDAVAQWCRDQQLPAGSCVPIQITKEQVTAAGYVRQEVRAAGGTASLEVPWSMTGQEVPGAQRFTDPGSGAILRVRVAGPDATPVTLAGAEAEFGSPDSPPVLARSEPDGFTLSGITADGDIYYWRQYRTPESTLDVVWTYPSAERETFDEAVVRAVRSFQGPL